MSRLVGVVAHTHWDREWYAPFETYQTRLVEVLDGLLDLLESDGSYRYFLLDGQAAIVDDYLAVRPDQEPRLRALVGAGRIGIGPWYVLMDEFCVSAETLVRNLQRGLQVAQAFGAGAPVGYLPDMFGHVAQMPQILHQAGLDHAVVWRGVPAAVDRTAFWWSAPDGSRVRAEYLPTGYANGTFLPTDPAALVRRIEAYVVEVGEFLRPSWPLLLMNGGDHQNPEPWLPELLEAANAGQDRLHFEQTALPDYLDVAPTEGLSEWSGELRSGARANILMGVLSNRVDIKMAAAAAERSLEKVAEPLAVLWLPESLWPGGLLDRAWLEVIRNSAHDSICACSADAVGRAVRHRYDSALAWSGEVTGQAAAMAEMATTATGALIVNPAMSTRSGVVEFVVGGDVAPPGTQAVESWSGSSTESSGTGDDLGRILGELARDGWLGDHSLDTDADLTVDEDGVRLTLYQDRSQPAGAAVASLMAEARTQAGAARQRHLAVRVERVATQRVAAHVPDVPGFGWASWQPGPLRVAPVERWQEAGLRNGEVVLEVDPVGGTFSINGHPGLNRVVEEGDAGDSYNFSPQPGDIPIDEPDSVRIEVSEAGPVRGRIEVGRTYRWPAGPDSEPSNFEKVEVVSQLELRAGENFVRVMTSFHNRTRDHRVRVLFPLPDRADETVAECAFATVRRGGAEGGPHEFPLATFPSRRFVAAGGLTVAHDGLLEYELVDGGGALALTVLRATGILSRPAPAYRPNRAGPADVLLDTQMPGPHQVRYVVCVGDCDPWRLADDAWTPFLTVASRGTGQLPPRGTRLRVEGAELSALYRRAGAIEIRLFNPRDSPATVVLAGHSGWLVDLLGQPQSRWSDHFELAPWAFATARLDASSLD